MAVAVTVAIDMGVALDVLAAVGVAEDVRVAVGLSMPVAVGVSVEVGVAAEVATGPFRTAAEIRAWVQERWGVSYTEGGMYALLRRLRCAPKVPRPIHEQADHLAQARWKKGGSETPSTRSA